MFGDIIFAGLYGLLIAVAGIFIGCGNHSGLPGAIITGLIFGLIAAIPCFRDHFMPGVAITLAGALVGCIIANYLPDSGAVKRLANEQSSLHIKVFSYELGRERSE